MRPYALAVVFVLLALGLRLLLHSVLGEAAPFLLFVPAVLLASRQGGFGPGLLATVLSMIVVSYFILIPVGSLEVSRPASIVQLALFAGIGVTVSLISSRLRQATERAGGRLQALQASQEEVRQLAASLEQRVIERTAQLEEANQALQAFAYSVSHDLRAPLRAMQGFSEALLEDYGEQLEDTGREYARRIVAASERMDRLIGDLLAYSRLSRAEMIPQNVSLQEVLDEACRELSADLQARGAEVVTAGALPAVRAHRATLIQALINLLSNAVTYVAPGVAPRVRVWAEPRDERVRLWVEDNGIGIASEHQERIFRVFERLHGIETYAGTGVGLAIVRKGLERMGGGAGVESEPGAGSRFWIELPQVKERT